MKLKGFSAARVNDDGELEISVTGVLAANEEIDGSEIATLVSILREVDQGLGSREAKEESDGKPASRRSRSKLKDDADDASKSDGGNGRRRSRKSKGDGDETEDAGESTASVGGDSGGSKRRRRRASSGADEGADGAAKGDDGNGRRRRRGGKSEADEKAETSGSSGRRRRKGSDGDSDNGGSDEKAEEKPSRRSRRTGAKASEPKGPTKREVIKAATEAADAIGQELVVEIMTDDFKVEDIDDLDKKHYQDFIDALEKEVEAQNEED